MSHKLSRFKGQTSVFLGAVLILSVGIFFASKPAIAGIGVGVAPDFPATVTVGQTNVAVGLEITNSSTSDVGSVTLDNIFLTPQCGDFSVPCTMADPGVFSVSASGTGANACAANTFTIAEVDASTGRVQFTPNSTISLGLGATCRINFTVNVLKVPTKDAAAAAGVQTIQSGQVTAHDANNLPGSGTGTDITTVGKASPQISTTPHPSSGPVGTTLNDTATLSGGSSPSGTVTFKLFPPSDPTCAGTASYTDADASAPYDTSTSGGGFVSNATGTWHWTAHYGGDANNNSADSACASEAVTVNMLDSTVTTHIHNANHQDITNTTVAPGTVIHDNATVSGSGPTPTGTVNFMRFANSGCTGDHVDQNDVALVSGVAESSTFTTTTGSLGYIVHYNGDANYSTSTGICESLTVSKQDSTTVTHIHDANHNVVTSVPTGTMVHDNATVSGSGPTPTGTVDFMRFATGDCSGTSVDENNVALVSGSAESSAVAASGTAMSYKAHYNGDANYNVSTGGCEPLTVVSVQGCSPGYWKQPQHFGSYPQPPYPNTLFVTVFGEDAFPNMTLLQVLSQGGGGLNALGRIIVGAYLNASAIKGFPFTPAQVVADFQAVFPGTNSAYDALKSKYEALQDPCPLGNNPGSAGPTSPTTLTSTSTSSSSSSAGSDSSGSNSGGSNSGGSGSEGRGSGGPNSTQTAFIGPGRSNGMGNANANGNGKGKGNGKDDDNN